MTRCLCLALSLSVLPLLAAEPPGGPAPDVPELKALANYAGKWATEATYKAAGQPLFTVKGQTVGEWIHDGNFLRQTWNVAGGKDQPGLNGSTIATYDSRKKTYRSWLFTSTGAFTEATVGSPGTELEFAL